MATFVFLLAVSAAFTGLVAYARRDRFTGPGIATGRSARGGQYAAASVRSIRPPSHTERHDLVPAPRCAC